MVARQVWAGPGVDILGGPSPDGRYLSYPHWKSGNLAIRDLATGQNRHLTSEGTWQAPYQFAIYSAISPDGRRVAYAWFNQGINENIAELRIVGLDGSEPRVLYRNEEVESAQPHAWSADGKYILALFGKRDGTHQIALVSAADGFVRVLKSLDWRSPIKMSLSLDGRYIVYDFPPKENSPVRDVFLLATDGSREVSLVQHPADDYAPLWEPDGRGVLFVSDRAGTTGIWLLPVVNGKPQGSPELVKKDMGQMLPLGFNGKGALYYGVRRNAVDVYVAELDFASGKFRAAPAKAVQRYVGANFSPIWSPDGDYLVYLSRRGQFPFGSNHGKTFVIRSLKTGEEREISPKLASIRGVKYSPPRWSPEGRFILAAGVDAKGRYGLYRIEVQTGNVKSVMQTRGFQRPTWSADGKQIFYQHRDREEPDTNNIVVRAIESGREKELFHGHVHGLSLSRDGQQLAFFAFTGDPENRLATLKFMPATGGDTRDLLTFPGKEIPDSVALEWTPDGRFLLFAKSAGEVLPSSEEQSQRTLELWRVSTQDGAALQVGPAMDGLRSISIHPDGRRIAFTAGSGLDGEVWVLENFLPKPEAEAARLEE